MANTPHRSQIGLDGQYLLSQKWTCAQRQQLSVSRYNCLTHFTISESAKLLYRKMYPAECSCLLWRGEEAAWGTSSPAWPGVGWLPLPPLRPRVVVQGPVPGKVPAQAPPPGREGRLNFSWSRLSPFRVHLLLGWLCGEGGRPQGTTGLLPPPGPGTWNVAYPLLSQVGQAAASSWRFWTPGLFYPIG